MMNIILGATGQIGSAIIHELTENNEPVRGVIRNQEKADYLENNGIEVRIADYFDREALKDAVKGGDLIFLLTPEDIQSEDVLGDARILLDNYHRAIQYSGINAVVGLSSIGAQHESGTGNLLMSNMLENAFVDMKIPQVYVRPAYYYSNWLMYLPVIKDQGILPTFFPVEQKVAMISPMDVAEFIANKITGGINESALYELVGPENLSSKDVATIFGKVLGRKVTAQQIPQKRWKQTLMNSGFTGDAAHNLIEMTEAVIKGKARPEGKGQNPIALKTLLEQYLKERLT